MYYNGNGGRTDKAEAFRLMFKCMEKFNDSGAMYEVGRCYVFGWGTSVDIPRGVNYIRKSAAAGCEAAIDWLKLNGYR